MYQQEQQTNIIKQQMQQNSAECKMLAKIDFLQKEIKQYKEQVQDQKKLIKMNRDQIQILQKDYQQQVSTNLGNITLTNPPTQSFQQQQQIHQFGNQNSSQRQNLISTTCREANLQKSQQILLDSLFQENEKLYTIIEKIAKERDFSQGKALINEQIALGAQEHEMSLIDQFSNSIKQLKEEIKKKDLENEQLMQTINRKNNVLIQCKDKFESLDLSPDLILFDQKQDALELENQFNDQNKNKNIINSPSQFQPGTVVRYKEIFDPKGGEVKFQTRLQICQQLLRKTIEALEKYKTEKNELLALNSILSSEIVYKNDYIRQLELNSQQNQFNTFQNNQGPSVNHNYILNTTQFNQNASTQLNQIPYGNFNNNQQNNSSYNNNINNSTNIFGNNSFMLKNNANQQYQVTDPDDLKATILNKQKKIVGGDEDEETSFEDENLPDKVDNLKTKNQEKTKVPMLDLLKAKRIQDTTMKKQSQMQQQKEFKMQQQQLLKQMQQQQQQLQNQANQQQQNIQNQVVQPGQNSQQQQQIIQYQAEIQQYRHQELKYIEKINKLEEEVLQAKICVQEQMMKNRVMLEQRDDSIRELEELQERNLILIQANQRYEDKWQKVFHSLYFYREYYISDNKYFYQSKMKKNQDIPLLQGPGQQFQTSICNEFDVEDPYFSPESLVRFIKKKEQTQQGKNNLKIPKIMEINEQIFEVLSARNQFNYNRESFANNEEANQGIINGVKPQKQNLSKKQKDYNKVMEMRSYMLNMAKDLYQNEKLQKLQMSKQFQQQNINKNSIKHRKRCKSMDLSKKYKNFVILPLKSIRQGAQQTGLRYLNTQTMMQHNNPKGRYLQDTRVLKPQLNRNYSRGEIQETQTSTDLIFSPEGIPQKMKIWDIKLGMPGTIQAQIYHSAEKRDVRNQQFYQNNNLQWQNYSGSNNNNNQHFYTQSQDQELQQQQGNFNVNQYINLKNF